MKSISTKKTSIASFIVLALIFIFFSACNQEGRGFALPTGDIEAGKESFVSMSCNECHSTSDIEWRGNAENIHHPLGGDVSVVKTYGELVTSVMNPNHKIAKKYKENLEDGAPSPMINYNNIMTIQELVDIVSYLQDKYEIVTPPAYYHPF